MFQLSLFASADLRSQLLLCPDTELQALVLAALEFANAHPEILRLIEHDVDTFSKAKKQRRMDDARWLQELTPPLFPELPEPGEPGELRLGKGRPRLLDAQATLVMMLVRGYFQSLTSQDAVNRMFDSILLRTYFTARGMRLPSANCILDHVNAVTNETRERLFKAQVADIKREGLDDFSLLTIDSFSVEASTSWPTDSRIIMSLLARAYRFGGKLAGFGLPVFAETYMARWERRLKAIDFEMNCVCGKPGSAKKLKKLYREFLNISAKFLERLTNQHAQLADAWGALDIRPSRQRLAEGLMESVADDLEAVARVCAYTGDRVFNGVVLPAGDKVLSLSDTCAAFIKKGGRDPKIGYKPQVARSGNGFITMFELEQGNPADASRLLPVFNRSVENTGVVPKIVSADDGYACAAARAELLGKGVEVVSVNGSKGKRMTPATDWESEAYNDARDARSAVESLIFTLRHKLAFYRFSRRGIDAVRAEGLEKVIVYNFWRIGVVKRKLRAGDAATVARAA